MYRNAHILGLMSIAVGAFGLTVGNELRTTGIMAGLLALAAVAMAFMERRTTAATATGASVRPRDTNVQTKRLLMLMMAVGIIVYGGGAGTFSSFSAETVNTNSQVASGTLTMSDAVTGGQTCFSASGSTSAITADNINDLPAQQTLSGQNTTTALGACDQILNITNIAPGTFAGYGAVTIANTGSIDAQKLKMFAPYVNTALSSTTLWPANGSGLSSSLTSGNTVTTLSVGALARQITSGSKVDLDDGSGHTQSFTVATTANAGATSISVNSATANFSYPSGTTAVKSSGTVTTLAVLPIEGPVTTGDTLELDYGGTSQQIVAGASAGPLKTSITVNSFTPSIDFPIGTRVTDLSTDGLNGLNQQNIDCFDVRDSTSYSGSTTGVQLNFNNLVNQQDASTHWVTDATQTYTGPLCANLGFWIQEQTTVNGNTYNYCWYGDGAPSTSHPTNIGACRAPISGTFSTSPPYSPGFLPTSTTPANITFASALRGNVIATGTPDTITISQLGVANVTCTAAADAYIGATTISVKSCTNDGTVFTAGGGAPTIVDTTTLTNLSTDTQTVANFQTLHGANNQMEMPTLVANGTKAPSGANVFGVELGKSGAVGSSNGTVGSAPASRKFFFGVFLPSGTASFQNSFQGLRSTFGVGFHIDQF